MAVKDIRSNLKQISAVVGARANDGSIEGASIDTADFELGLMFALNITAYTSGKFSLELFESNVAIPDVGTGTPIVAGSDKLIGTLPFEVEAANLKGSDLLTVGLISNLQFVRADVVGTDTSVGTVSVIATQKAENMPVEA